jgi:hypothetical protein
VEVTQHDGLLLVVRQRRQGVGEPQRLLLPRRLPKPSHCGTGVLITGHETFGESYFASSYPRLASQI